MSRGRIWSLIGIGLFFWILGSLFGTGSLKTLGFLFLAGGIGLLVYGLLPGGILRKEEVTDNWSVLIENATGHAEDVFQTTEERLKASKAPNVLITRRRISPSFTRGIRGVARDFLVVTQIGNRRLDPFQMFINARDYGTNLAIDWHLTYRPTLLQLILMLFFIQTTGKNVLGELDLFDQQDLRTYVTNAHHRLLESVDALMESLNQNPSKIDRKPRGFLGIS